MIPGWHRSLRAPRMVIGYHKDPWDLMGHTETNRAHDTFGSKAARLFIQITHRQMQDTVKYHAYQKETVLGIILCIAIILCIIRHRKVQKTQPHLELEILDTKTH